MSVFFLYALRMTTWNVTALVANVFLVIQGSAIANFAFQCTFLEHCNKPSLVIVADSLF